MSEKRRDHRGRILHNGEIQLSDGRYRFKYVDEMGKGIHYTAIHGREQILIGQVKR